MTDLESIMQMCIDVFGVDPREKNRKILYVSCRFAYYYYIRENTKYSLHAIANEMGSNHATVLHGHRKYPQRVKDYKEHSKMFADIDILVDNYFDSRKASLDENMNYYDLRILALEKKLRLEQNKTAQLKHRLSNLRDRIPNVVEELLFDTDKEEVSKFVNLKVIPQLKAYRHYNPKAEA